LSTFPLACDASSTYFNALAAGSSNGIFSAAITVLLIRGISARPPVAAKNSLLVFILSLLQKDVILT
jgi:uncharacterized membrane protein YbhN (UPF0104 family)